MTEEIKAQTIQVPHLEIDIAQTIRGAKSLDEAATYLLNVLKNRDDAISLQSKSEPVAYQRLHPNHGWIEVSFTDIEHYKQQGQKVRPLFA